MNKICKTFFISVLFAVCTLGAANIGQHDVQAKTITVTTKKIPSVVKKYSNYNKYTKYSVAFNYYMKQLEKAGGGKFIIKKGTYEMSSSVYIPSNVKVILKDGVVLKNIYETGGAGYAPSNTIFMLCPYSKGHVKGAMKKYKGAKNITIEGQGNATIDNNYVEGGATITASHNKNIKITGITFKKQNGGHFIEVSGVNKVTISNNKFKTAKKSTKNKNYCKEAINIDTPDPNTRGLSAEWVGQDKTPCKNVTIENNIFSGVTRGVGTHKYSQDNGKNILHENIYIRNNKFNKIYDNGIFMLNWKNVIISDNTFDTIGKDNKKSYSSGAHGISGGGIEQVSITKNSFKNIKRNAVYFCVQQNVGAGSQYSKIKVNITNDETMEMLSNIVENCGNDMNEIFAGFDILYFRGNSERSRENGVGIDLNNQKIKFGIEKN